MKPGRRPAARSSAEPTIRLRNSKRVAPAEVRALFRAAGWTEDIASFAPAQIQKLLRHSHLVLTARNSDGELVGFASAVSDGVFGGLVQNLVVHPRYRRRGLGTRGKRARTFFRRVGFHPITWNVFLRHAR